MWPVFVFLKGIYIYIYRERERESHSVIKSPDVTK